MLGVMISNRKKQISRLRVQAPQGVHTADEYAGTLNHSREGLGTRAREVAGLYVQCCACLRRFNFAAQQQLLLSKISNRGFSFSWKALQGFRGLHIFQGSSEKHPQQSMNGRPAVASSSQHRQQIGCALLLLLLVCCGSRCCCCHRD